MELIHFEAKLADGDNIMNSDFGDFSERVGLPQPHQGRFEQNHLMQHHLLSRKSHLAIEYAPHSSVVQTITQSLLCETESIVLWQSKLERNCCINEQIRGDTDKLQNIESLSTRRFRCLSFLLTVIEQEMQGFSRRGSTQRTETGLAFVYSLIHATLSRGETLLASRDTCLCKLSRDSPLVPGSSIVWTI
jgi:hypothetical protein